MKIIPLIHFNGQCDEAIQLYKKAFGCTVKSLIHYSDAVNHGWEKQDTLAENRVYHSEILFGNQEVRLSDNSEEEAELSRQVVHLISFDTAEEVEEAFAVLREDGEILQPLEKPPYAVIIGTVKDRFGIQWNLVCDF